MHYVDQNEHSYNVTEDYHFKPLLFFLTLFIIEKKKKVNITFSTNNIKHNNCF